MIDPATLARCIRQPVMLFHPASQVGVLAAAIIPRRELASHAIITRVQVFKQTERSLSIRVALE